MSRLSLKKRLTLFVASILVAVTIILTSITLITIEKIMVRPQIETIGIISFTTRDGSLTNKVEVVREVDDDYINNRFLEEGNYGPRYRRRIKNNISNADHIMFGRDAVISDMKSAQSKISRISIMTMIGIIIFGVLGVYIMVDRALNPLKELSSTIHAIGEDNLNTHISVPIPEDEISSLIVSFNKMLSRLEIMFNEQKDFSAKAAHELKTPLTTMKTSLQVLQMDESPEIDEYEESIGLIEANIDRLIDIVNNLFLLSSDSIKLNDRVEISQVIKDVVEDRYNDILKENIELDLELDDLVVAGNRDLLVSCIGNVLDNAIKYNIRGGSIHIKSYRKGKLACISIRDTGIGIESSSLENIFDAFYRVGGNTIEGNGLGLSIVKNIIDEHRGVVDITSTVGEGTELLLGIPL